ncbi:uncharacterized protein LOC128790597 isoform X4 [Vidua chalybeata]|uniref:uncharacterized protein LOC128790597 isoform X4 n=1 Tax=Vidua chalybeata TaxID=81927 RepID=UPI0023A81C6F|nr:uncharacterized protein LOC128790597 isoform X4 [Vidua chalybeata]
MANTDTTPTQSTANMKASAPNLDIFGERLVSHPNELSMCLHQVPDFVRNMHQRLVSNAPPDDRMLMDILRLTEAYPTDVMVTLLRCAPSCDRAATIMWRTIASSGMAVDKVLPTLLCVLENWPLHRVSTSDGDKTRVFALAATRVVWEILRLPWCPAPFMEYSPRLLVALLFQVFVSTLDMPEEVNTFWKECQEQLNLPTSINRFAVQTVRALFRHLRCLDLLVAMECKRGWDTLLCADTHHYAMGLLAREMHHTSNALCSCIALRLLGLLSRQEPLWDLPALAFLVEVLECPDMREWSDSALEIISRHLQSKSRERRCLALRGLVVLSKDPSLDNSHVQVLSIQLFREVMELVMDNGKKPLKKHVSKSLLPLFFHCHDENWCVAEASQEALLCGAKFLKRRKLKQLVEKEQPWKFAEVLLAEDRSRAAEHLRRARPYLQSPQEPLREAAVRFMGIAGRYLRKQQEETQFIYKALQDLTDDISPAISSLAIQTLQLLRGVQRASYSPGCRRCKTTSRRVGDRKLPLCGSLRTSMNN